MKAPLIVAGIIFGLVALIHLSRLFCQFPLVIGTTLVPLWVNEVGFMIAAAPSFWMFYSLKCDKCSR